MKPESAFQSGVSRTHIASADTYRAATIPLAKRMLDLVIAGATLIFLSPVMLIIGALIKIQDGGQVFFIQRRRGQNGVDFFCMKFRTMHVDSDVILREILATDLAMAAEWRANQKFKRDPRVTCFGQFLRRTSLDELPQLYNIIRGEMSIVGPRPIVAEEVHRYGEQIRAYDSVRPGVTGLWQVNGRSEVSYDRRVAYDVEYSKSMSLTGDLLILLKTIPAVLFARGAA